MKWIPIDRESYRKIASTIDDKLVVHGSSTDMEGIYHNGKAYILTEWGFKNSDAPILKYECIGMNERYFIGSAILIDD